MSNKQSNEKASLDFYSKTFDVESIPCSNITMPEVELSWDYNSMTSVTIHYGKIVNTGKVKSGNLRIAFYILGGGWINGNKSENDVCDLAGSFEIPAIEGNDSYRAGKKTITLKKSPVVNGMEKAQLEKYENGEWIECCWVMSPRLNAQTDLDRYKRREKAAASKASSTTTSGSTSTVSGIKPGIESSKNKTNTQLGHTNLDFKSKTWKITDSTKTFSITYERIENKSTWASGRLRFAVYYSQVSKIKDSFTCGRTLIGATEPFKSLSAGYHYDEWTRSCSISQNVPIGNFLLMVLEEEDADGNWCWRNGIASTKTGPF